MLGGKKFNMSECPIMDAVHERSFSKFVQVTKETNDQRLQIQRSDILLSMMESKVSEPYLDYWIQDIQKWQPYDQQRAAWITCSHRGGPDNVYAKALIKRLKPNAYLKLVKTYLVKEIRKVLSTSTG